MAVKLTEPQRRDHPTFRVYQTIHTLYTEFDQIITIETNLKNIFEPGCT